jgi:hypothetical protein
VIAVVGRHERRPSLSCIWTFQEPAEPTSEARLTVLYFNSIDTVYFFLNRVCVFVTGSLSATRYSLTAHHHTAPFYDHPPPHAFARKHGWDIKNKPQKWFRTFLLMLTKVKRELQTVWATLIHVCIVIWHIHRKT